MKALIQKDLRENLKVALIGLLIFSLLLLQAYQESITLLNNLLLGRQAALVNGLQPLLSKSLQAEAAFFCGIFGAVLGWLQSRNEAHRDLWAFLIHRPVTRTEIFRGKAIAGLCLYVFGAGLPLAVLVAVVRTPGHIPAPFERAMVLPLASIFLSGVSFYFAGLLTGLRPARWYGSRGLGLGLAFIACLSAFNFLDFWQSLIVITLAVVILATAVWGAYQSGGCYRGQPAGGRLALTAAMAGGCVVVLFAGDALLMDGVVKPLSGHSSPFVASYYEMSRDGVIYKVTTRDNEMVEAVDLNGHPLADANTGGKTIRAQLSEHQAYGASVGTQLGDRNMALNAVGRRGYFFAIQKVVDKTIWYLDRHGKLLGYDSRTRKFIGSMDPRGSDGALTSEGFIIQPYDLYYYFQPDSEQTWRYMATAKTVYRADFKARELKPIFRLPKDDEIGGYAVAPSGYDGMRSENLLITTRKTVCLLDSEGRTLFAVPYQPGYVGYPTVEISVLEATNGSTANFGVWFYPDERMNGKSGWKMPIHVLWIGPGQTVAKTADLPALRQPEQLPSWPDKLATTFLPPAAHLMFGNNISNPWYPISFSWAVISAGIGWALTRRYNYSIAACVSWTLFIFALGIAGLLTLLCVQEWPARLACPHCGKLRAVDRETCEHCQSPFAPPEKNGTEIFAPLAKDAG